jgi:RNA polymerase sigma factor
MQFSSINQRVEYIKDKEEEINGFVEEYKPFIASCVEKVTGRYVKYGEDDELSIAMLAFVEAVKSYEEGKGSFLSFAQNVIKRRLIDYYRKEKKHSNVISINEYYGDEEEFDLSEAEAVDNYSKDQISEYRRMELEQLKKELSEWDITFLQLADASPKHDKTRKMYLDIVKYLLSNPHLTRQLRQKKYLPVAEIEKSLNIPRKKIDRARKYIIAVILITTGDYQYINDFIDWR